MTEPRRSLLLSPLLFCIAAAAMAEPPAKAADAAAHYVVFVGTGAADIQRPAKDACPV